MNAHVLFRTNDILVTPAMARFGAVSYQVAGITSVAVHHRPKLNPIAVTLVVAAVALAAFAYLAREQQPDLSLWSAGAAPAALIFGMIWQRIRPVLEYRLVVKTAGSETETVTSFDRTQVFELREAIESAFYLQYSQLGETRVAHIEPQTAEQPEEAPPPRVEPRLVDEPPEQGLHITRDWVVANVDLAPR
jgi:uncharacterized protein DUF6232